MGLLPLQGHASSCIRNVSRVKAGSVIIECASFFWVSLQVDASQSSDEVFDVAMQWILMAVGVNSEAQPEAPQEKLEDDSKQGQLQ